MGFPGSPAGNVVNRVPPYLGPPVTRKSLVVGFLLLNAVWTFAMLVAPYTLSDGTVRGLHGRSNVLDYSALWRSLPWYAAATYAFGDINCHQMESRSLLLNGNQLPVDARMTAMFIAANLGLLAVLLVPQLARARDEAVFLVPARWRAAWQTPRARGLLLALLLLAGLVPTAIDGFAQLLTTYESTNALRLLTGAFLGFFGALWTGLVFDSLVSPLRFSAPSGASPAQ